MISKLSESLRKFLNNEDGASLVEYGLLVALIALVAIGGITLAGTKISALFSAIAEALPT